MPVKIGPSLRWILRFTFHIQHSKEQLNSAPDVLSRFPYRTKEEQHAVLEAIHVSPSFDDIASCDDMEVRAVTCPVLASLDDAGPIMTVTAVAVAAEHDNEYQALLQTISKGFPLTKTEVPGMIRQYWSVREILHEYEGVTTQPPQTPLKTSIQPTRASLVCGLEQNYLCGGQASTRTLNASWPLACIVDTWENHSHVSLSAQHLAQHTPLSLWWPTISIMAAINAHQLPRDSLAGWKCVEVAVVRETLSKPAKIFLHDLVSQRKYLLMGVQPSHRRTFETL